MYFFPDKFILEKKMVVYEIENTITGDCYLGITTNQLKKRIHNHLNSHSKSSFSGCGTRTLMYEDFKKYGIQNFVLKILYIGKSKKQLLSFESTIKHQEKYFKYASRDINKDTSSKENLNKKVCLIDSKGRKLIFDSPMDVTREFKCSRTNIVKAIKDKYLFLREYIAFYIDVETETEQLKLF